MRNVAKFSRVFPLVGEGREGGKREGGFRSLRHQALKTFQILSGAANNDCHLQK